MIDERDLRALLTDMTSQYAELGNKIREISLEYDLLKSDLKDDWKIGDKNEKDPADPADPDAALQKRQREGLPDDDGNLSAKRGKWQQLPLSPSELQLQAHLDNPQQAIANDGTIVPNYLLVNSKREGLLEPPREAPMYQHIPQSGVTGVSWYGGIGNNNYWVAQWHENRRQKKELFPTGKQTPLFPLGSNYSEALRAAIRRRRERVRVLGLKSRQRVDVYPPISTLEAFPLPENALVGKEEELIGHIIEFLREKVAVNGLHIKYAVTSDVCRYFYYYMNVETEHVNHIIMTLLNQKVLIEVRQVTSRNYQQVDPSDIDLPYAIYFNNILQLNSHNEDSASEGMQTELNVCGSTSCVDPEHHHVSPYRGGIKDKQRQQQSHQMSLTEHENDPQQAVVVSGE